PLLSNVHRSRRFISRQQALLAVLLLVCAALLAINTSSLSVRAGRQSAARTDRSVRPQSPAAAGPQSGAKCVANVLNEDGTVKPGANGGFDASGFRMEYDPNGAPRFVPAPAVADACPADWDTQFGANGVGNSVHALAVMGSDLYVGGISSWSTVNIGGGGTPVPINHIAKFATTTGTWSALSNG